MIQVKHNQSFLDVVLQSTGGFVDLFKNAIENSKSISDEVIPGEFLNINTAVIDKDIYEFFKNKEIVPAFALSENDVNQISPTGIGFMQIENNFKVS
jgi:hypothetical protein